MLESEDSIFSFLCKSPLVLAVDSVLCAFFPHKNKTEDVFFERSSQAIMGSKGGAFAFYTDPLSPCVLSFSPLQDVDRIYTVMICPFLFPKFEGQGHPNLVHLGYLGA